MMHPNNHTCMIKKSTTGTSASRSIIPFFMNSKAQQQQQRNNRPSTEKIFAFILLISVSFFQLALHYSSMDLSRRGETIIHHDETYPMQMPMESTGMAGPTGFSSTRSHRLAHVCPNIKSTKYAPASIQPKIPISSSSNSGNEKDKAGDEKGQRFIASGGYEAIAKGSGPIHAAGPIVNLISKIQHVEFHMFGTVAEVGVHHGRFTSFLFITARTTEKLVVVDLFEELQDLNVDLSGFGNYKQFVQGMSLYGLQAADLFQVHKGSTDQIPFDWANQNGFEPFRLVSIDAGHTAALTFNDLQLAFCNLLKGGVVIIDDWYVT
jgi:hypothetical protein